MTIALALAVWLSASVTPVADLRSVPWRSEGVTRLQATTDLKVQAQAIANELLPDADILKPDVGEALFADIDRDGGPELLILFDVSGRGFFNNLLVVRQQGGGLVASQLHCHCSTIEGLAGKLVDIDGDGKAELVLSEYIDRYEGAQRVPMQDHVYSLSNGAFADVSDRHPAYYRSVVVPRLERALAAARARAGQSDATGSPATHEVFVLEQELLRAKKLAAGR